jgi:hypothetical protein
MNGGWIMDQEHRERGASERPDRERGIKIFIIERG